MSCPNGTTSAVGAASIWECYCSGDFVDTDPQLDSLECTDSMLLSENTIASGVFAASQATVFSFNGTLLVTDASSESLVSDIQQQLGQFLEITLGSRAYLDLTVRFDTSWYVDLTVWSSERAIAEEMLNKFDPLPFSVWISSNAIGTVLDGATGVDRSTVESVHLRCPEGLGLPDGRFVRGLDDCKCPHGKQPAVAGGTGVQVGCAGCPLGTYKSSVADTACTSCPSPLTTIIDGAVAYSACIYICAPGFYNDIPSVPTSCVECGLGFYCFFSKRQQCPESESTLSTTASTIDECFCDKGFSFDNGCVNCTVGKYKPSAGDPGWFKHDCGSNMQSLPNGILRHFFWATRITYPFFSEAETHHLIMTQWPYTVWHAEFLSRKFSRTFRSYEQLSS